ncbi:DinB family protein [uncultured Shimia sp.]|uniref:DinB family protein n=1 Tax=uncultured Shimia sp. TaxID=573152 RepID=UPI002607ECEF|nr:DinB family protein [uncultured Shimia sp.]
MISVGYCQMMARYNAWQNEQVKAAAERLTEAELRADRGAFFNSIMGTLNHLLWGDLLWMSRFDGGEGPSVGPEGHTTLAPTLAVWSAERFRTDGRIRLWADRLHEIDLTGDMSWVSTSDNQDVTFPMAQVVAGFFNHQTHHRGQVHAMLTAAGQDPGNTDLTFMPEEPTWR